MHKTKTNCPDDFTKNISAASNHTFTSSLVHLKFHIQGVLTKKKKRKKKREALETILVISSNWKLINKERCCAFP